VRVFREAFDKHIRETVVGGVVSETNDAGGDVVFDVVLLHVNVLVSVSLIGRKGC